MVIANLPRGIRLGPLTKKWEAAQVDAKWASSAWAKKLAQRKTRSELGDFERFQVLRAKRARREHVRKAVAKARKQA